MQECMVECQKMVREVVDLATSSAENDISIETLRKRVQDKFDF
jgi:hypothetical protein